MKYDTQYQARWVTPDETRRTNHHNGVLEHRQIAGPPEFICFISPMALAKRVAHAMNVAEYFSNDELERLSEALKPPYRRGSLTCH